jgi:type II secretory pathway component GspD/PulD (secretin)
MKLKLSILTLVGLTACSLAGFAQTNNPPSEAPAGAGSDPVADSAAPASETPKTTPTTDAPTPADAPSAEPAPAPAPSSLTLAVEVPAPAKLVAANDNQPPAVTPPPTPGNTPPPAPAALASTGSNAPVIPLIVMDDVPLSDAIKNLARQAGLNYMLDPKIQFGQPGPDGRPIPQPSVSIRWENVTAEQALGALLNNHNLQLVEEPKTRISRVTVRDPAAPEPLLTHVIQLKFANPSNIIASVQTALVDRRSKVMGDTRTSQLVVLATEKELASVDELVNRLDTQTKQVLIEARLIETSINPTSKKGLDWTGTLQNQKLSFGNNLQQNPPAAALNNTLSESLPKMLFDTAKGFNPATAFLDADGVSAVFSFLNTDSEAKVLSAPRTVTLDNETASISVTRASPIFKNTAGTQGSPGGSEVTYTNLGVILNVTPRISANNFVNLRVVPEVSRVFDTVRKTVASTVNEADEYDIRKIDTHVMIPSGNTLVLGGMVQDDVRNSHTKVPFLGDIPLLGHAFRSGSKSRQQSNLLIFITPTIVTDEDYQPTKTDYLKTPVPTSDSVDAPWTAWDSGKPLDWSKPVYEEAKFHRDPTK